MFDLKIEITLSGESCNKFDVKMLGFDVENGEWYPIIQFFENLNNNQVYWAIRTLSGLLEFSPIRREKIKDDYDLYLFINKDNNLGTTPDDTCTWALRSPVVLNLE